MVDQSRNWRGKILELLGLRLSAAEQLRYRDPYDLLEDPGVHDRHLKVAIVAAFLFHVVLFMIPLARTAERIFIPNEDVVMLTPLDLTQAGAPAGGDSPKLEPAMSKPTPTIVPVPDPTPDEPEPIREVEEKITPAPAVEGPKGESAGSGGGPGGTGPGLGGSGGDIYHVGTGAGVTPPVVLVQTRPSYTDDAIRAKVEGIVLLQAVIRKDGTIDSFRVLRGLGHGLDERAIQEISAKWRFRPGTLGGRPVDIQSEIEITFTLR